MACERHSDHEFVDGRCIHCDVSYADALRGFGMNSSAFSMPPSKRLRRKNAVAKRFGQALSGE